MRAGSLSMMGVIAWVLAIGLLGCGDSTGPEASLDIAGEYEEVATNGSYLSTGGICSEPRFVPDFTRETILTLRQDGGFTIVVTVIAHCPEGDVVSTGTTAGTYVVTGTDLRLDVPNDLPLIGEFRSDGTLQIEFGFPGTGFSIISIFRRR